MALGYRILSFTPEMYVPQWGHVYTKSEHLRQRTLCPHGRSETQPPASLHAMQRRPRSSERRADGGSDDRRTKSRAGVPIAAISFPPLLVCDMPRSAFSSGAASSSCRPASSSSSTRNPTDAATHSAASLNAAAASASGVVLLNAMVTRELRRKSGQDRRRNWKQQAPMASDKLG